MKNALLLNDTTSWYHWGCTATSLGIGESLCSLGLTVATIPIWETYSIKLSPTEKVQDMGERFFEVDVLDDDAYFAAFCLANPQWVERLRNTDIVIINGEGTLHGIKPSSSGLLYLAYLAKTRFGLPVSIINHSVYPQSNGVFEPQGRAELFYSKVYRALDNIAVRESKSLQNCRAMGVNATLAFDCMPLTIRRHFDLPRTTRKNKLLLSGCVCFNDAMVKLYADLIRYANAKAMEVEFLIGAADHLSPDDQSFIKQLDVNYNAKWRQVQADSLNSWFQSIAEAGILISGRFHHTIAALCLGTPFIVIESNTPKISGMLETLGCGPALSSFDPQLKNKVFSLLEGRLGKHADPKLHQLAQSAEKNFSFLS